MCILVYQMDIQIYDQISIQRNYSKVKLHRAVSLRLGLKGVKIAQVLILRSWSKVKLHRAVLIGFGLKEPKIDLNIVKFGVHYYLPNAHLNLWSNFISVKLVKSETSSCGFAKFGVKGGENSSKCRESWSAQLSIKRASNSMIKFQFWEISQKWNFVVHFR